MSLPGWKVVDRYQLTGAVRRLCAETGGGLLIVRGDDYSERSVAADVVEDFISDFGMNPIRVRLEAGRAIVVKHLLATAWHHVEDPQGAHEVPPSIGASRFMSGIEIVREIAARCHVPAHESRAFIFDTIDPNGRIPRSEISLFADLAAETRSPVVVFLRKESDSGITRAAQLLELGDMPLWEVRASVHASPALAHVSRADADALLSEISTLASNGDTICAVDAYDVLEAGLRRMSTP